MTPIRLLARLLGAGGALQRGAAPAIATEPLRRSGLVRIVGAVETLICDACDEPHVAEVERAEGRFRAFCREAGWVEIDPAAVEILQIEMTTLVEQLRTALGARLAGPRHVDPVWLLGTIDLATAVAARVFFAPRIATPLDLERALRAIPREGRRALDILLAGSVAPDLELRGTSTAEVLAVDLAEVTDFEGDALSIDRDALMRLAMPAAAPPRPKPGPPAKFEGMVRAVVEHLWDVGDAPRGGRPLPAAVREAWPLVHGDASPPKERTLRELIAKICG